MKTKLYWLTLIMSAVLAGQAQAGGHQGGGGTFSAPVAHGGGGFARGGAPSFYSAPGGRMVYSGQRFSSPAFRSPHINPSGRAFAGTQRVNPGNINRNDRLARSPGAGNRNGTGQIRNGNNLPANWRNHVVAQHSADWHRDWDRGHDHWWHGHHCRFVNGSWFIFDAGFDPWWPYWYPYDYYAGDYYPYSYGYYYSVYQGEPSYDQNGYADQSDDSTVASAQDRLAQQGYYRGTIDGVPGAQTRRAVAQYQRDHGMRVTGALTTATLQALGLRGVANN